MNFNSDEGSLDDGSSMYNSSMEFEAVNAAPGGGIIIAPLSNAPLTGFKHKGGGSSDKGGGGGSLHKGSNSSSKDNTNSNSPRGYNNDSSMENSVDSMEGHAVAALERVNLNVSEKRGRGFLDDKPNRQSRRPTLDAEEELRLEKYVSPLLANKSSSRHIPPLAPPIKNVGDAGEVAVEPENKGVVLTGHTGSVNHLAKLGSKGDMELMDFVVSAGSDSTVRIWNVVKGMCVGRCTDVNGGADQGAISALTTVQDGGSGSSIVTGNDNGYIRLWDLGRSEGGDATLQSKFAAHKGRITCLVSEKEGAGELVNTPRLVSSGTDRTIRMWDPRMRKPQVFLFKGHTDTVNTILLDASSSCVVSGGRDQSVRIWDIRTGRQRR
jgi:WD40 repeat protein